MRDLGNIFLAAIFLLLMNYPLLGSAWHEYFGAVFTVVMLLHVSHSQRWFKALFYGQKSVDRLIGTALSLLLVLAILVTVVTGLLISTTVFPVAQLRGAVSIWAHELHQSSAYSSFILTGIHLGLHWNAIWFRIKRRLGSDRTGKRYYRLTAYVLPAIIMGYAVYASFANHMGDRLMMEHMVSIASDSTPLQYGRDLAMIFAGYATGAYILKKFIASIS